MTCPVRPFRPADAAACLDVYLDAIHNGTAPHYSAEERAAWAPPGREYDHGEWTGRLADGRTWVAEHEGKVVGFITLDRSGHLDLFFVRPEARLLGVAAKLYEALINTARDGGHTRLTTHASHLARRFLERRGWRVTGEERALRNGVFLTRFAMELPELSATESQTSSVSPVIR